MMPLGIQRNKILNHRRPQNQANYFRTSKSQEKLSRAPRLLLNNS